MVSDNTTIAIIIGIVLCTYLLFLENSNNTLYIKNLFNNPIFRVAFLSLLVVFTFERYPFIALIIAFIFVLTSLSIFTDSIRENYQYVDAIKSENI